jgi:hypothetical protein
MRHIYQATLSEAAEMAGWSIEFQKDRDGIVISAIFKKRCQ